MSLLHRSAQLSFATGSSVVVFEGRPRLRKLFRFGAFEELSARLGFGVLLSEAVCHVVNQITAQLGLPGTRDLLEVVFQIDII